MMYHFAAIYTFLAINGKRLTAGSADAYEFISRLHGESRFSFDELVPWLRRNIEVRA